MNTKNCLFCWRDSHELVPAPFTTPDGDSVCNKHRVAEGFEQEDCTRNDEPARKEAVVSDELCNRGCGNPTHRGNCSRGAKAPKPGAAVAELAKRLNDSPELLASVIDRKRKKTNGHANGNGNGNGRVAVQLSEASVNALLLGLPLDKKAELLSIA